LRHVRREDSATGLSAARPVETDPNDGRVSRVSATSEGEQVLQRGRRRRVERLGGRLAKLAPREVETIRHADELVEHALAE
jgi:DNA-binding MarR family transcriptional regulator